MNAGRTKRLSWIELVFVASISNRASITIQSPTSELGLAPSCGADTFCPMQASPAPTDQASATPELSTEKMHVAYANLCRGMMTAEEIVLDFGFNPNSGGRVLDEPAAVSSRIIMSVPSTVRLYQLLHALLAKRQEAVQQAQASSSADAAESGKGGTTPPA
jgi:hypothetical protein